MSAAVAIPPMEPDNAVVCHIQSLIEGSECEFPDSSQTVLVDFGTLTMAIYDFVNHRDRGIFDEDKE